VFSPLGALILDQKSPDTAGVYETKSSPPGITDYLKKNPPVGQTFQPQHWGDWLVRNVPGFRPFATTNIHLIPQRVWEDYLKIGMASSGWQAATDRYNITTLILDKENQPPIVAEMRHAPGWELLYEDDQGVVYGRTPPKRSTTTNLSSERGPASGQQNSTSTNAPEAP
jgi:hypothetical protein